MALDAFRRNELERKMLEAAGRRDYEQAIVHRDALKALDEEIASRPKPPAFPKVVVLATGEEYVPPEQPETDQVDDQVEEERFVDTDAVELLKKAIEDVEAGRVVGVAILKGMDDGHDGIEDVFVDISGCVLDYSTLFVGAATRLAHDILEIEEDSYFDEDEDEEE